MSKQFDFIKPIVRIDEQLLLDSGYSSIFGVKFFRYDIPKERETRYRDDRQWKQKTTYLQETRNTKAAEKVSREQRDLFNQFQAEDRKWRNVVIGGIYCPFTDKKLKDIHFGWAESKSTTLHYMDKEEEVKERRNAVYYVLDPRKVNVQTKLDGWYAPEVLEVMRDEWAYSNTTNIDLNAPDLTVLSDDIERVDVFYSKRGYTSVENKRIYVSTNGRYFKNRGTKNVYIDSPAIDDFLTKIKNK